VVQESPIGTFVDLHTELQDPTVTKSFVSWDPSSSLDRFGAHAVGFDTQLLIQFIVTTTDLFFSLLDSTDATLISF
jgi:hypothetical protein